MFHSESATRREFLSDCRVAAVGVAALGWGASTIPQPLTAAEEDPGWLKLTVKAGMIRVPGAGDDEAGWTRKLQTAKDAGFLGVEPNTSKQLNTEAINAASKATGVIVDGTVGGYHWKTRHTDPDPKTRAEAQALLERGLKMSAAMGCESMLLVPGHGKDGTPDEVLARATEAVQKALPLAEKLKVQILIENVWNHFLYDHDGDSNQSVQPLADWLSSFGSEWLGTQFDLGNHWKYGNVAEWVTTLGPLIKKLDIKGFSREKNKFTDIGEGDVDWASIRKALANIGFTGWLAAEVGGGDQGRLTKVAKQMRDVLWTDKTLSEAKS